MEPVDVVDLVHESVERLQSRLAERSIDVHVQMPPDPVVVRGDHLMLLHVLDNLVENAVTHAGDGRWLSVGVDTDGTRALVEVTDRGEGIPPEELPRVFEKFYRRKGTRQRGTGLGLAIVRRIVDDHGGRVELTSAVGRGTTARVQLPLAESQA